MRIKPTYNKSYSKGRIWKTDGVDKLIEMPSIMKRRLHTWVTTFLLFIILTAGCMPAVHKSLDLELADHTYQARVLSNIPKEEIAIHIEEKQYTSAGGGLLWVLIDKGINKARGSAAEKRVAPLLEASADVDFRTQYWNALQKTLAESTWLKVKYLDQRSSGYTKEEMAEVSPPFLILNTVYELSPNSQVLLVQTKASLYLDDLRKPNYFGFYSYFSDKAGKDDEINEDAIALWDRNNAASYREAITEGIEQNMYMLQVDLLDSQANVGTVNNEEIQMHIRDPISGSMRTYKGHVLNRKKNRVIMREKGGNLFSIATGLEE